MRMYKCRCPFKYQTTSSRIKLHRHIQIANHLLLKIVSALTVRDGSRNISDNTLAALLNCEECLIIYYVV